MELFDAAAEAAPTMEKLLDFSSVTGGDGETKLSVYEAFPPAASFTETGEEELEWLLNENAFPEVEYESIMDTFPEEQQVLTASKHHSPVSVLENSSSSDNSNVIGRDDFRFPVKPRSNPHRKRRIVGVNDGQQLCLWGCGPVSVVTKGKGGRKSGGGKQGGGVIGRKCLHCGADKTPQWRAGPMGPKTLCNACGVRYKSGRLVPEYRPASSPSFVSELHSNSHRKIVEMRRQKQLQEMGVLGKTVAEKGLVIG